jgi:hypothetical protein
MAVKNHLHSSSGVREVVSGTHIPISRGGGGVGDQIPGAGSATVRSDHAGEDGCTTRNGFQSRIAQKMRSCI